MAVNTSQGYYADVTLQFEYGNTRVDIRNEQIIYIMVEENYMERVLPIIHISISVNNDIYCNIINYRETAHFYLNISTTDKLSYQPVTTETLSGKFKYIPETTNTDFGAKLNESPNTSLDTSYRTINIGLVSEDQTALLRRSFNGIYKNIDSATLISIGVEQLNKVVIEPLENNVKYNQIIIPPVGSIYKFLQYVYDKDAFYNTAFRFFMTFDKTYLLSQRGISFGKTNNSVIFDIQDITNIASMADGMDKKNGSYYVYINAMNAKFSSNQSTSQIMNNITAYDDTTNTNSYDLDNNGKGRTTYVRSRYGNVVKNEIESSDLRVDLMKENMDGTIFTPDKQYSIIGSGDSSRYNGTYILLYKRVFYKSVDGTFNITCNMGFKPAKSNSVAHKDAMLLRSRSKAVSQSAKVTKSSEVKNTSEARKSTLRKSSKLL